MFVAADVTHRKDKSLHEFQSKGLKDRDWIKTLLFQTDQVTQNCKRKASTPYLENLRKYNILLVY